jgi:RimJ/RimL family protein N-acetyltransferase
VVAEVRRATGVRFAPLGAVCLQAMLDGDLPAASTIAGAALPPFFLEEGWLWRIRLEQLGRDPSAAPWLVRAVVLDPGGEVIGHGGFHGPPDADGFVEVAYTVIPHRRGQGHAHEILRALLDDVADRPDVVGVRASVSPGNAASLATVRRAGFVQTGEQWDQDDGLELIFTKQSERGQR